MTIDPITLHTELELTAVLRGAAALVFDWNGTVVDDLDRAVIATNTTLAHVGKEPIDPQTFSATFQLPLDRFFTNLGVDQRMVLDSITCWNKALADLPSAVQPAVLDVFAQARAMGMLTGVISAASDAALEADMALIGTADTFGFVLGSVQDKAAALRTITASVAGRVVYVGDTEYDMIAASDAGAIGLAYTRGYRPASALAQTPASVLFDDYRVLTAALQRLR